MSTDRTVRLMPRELALKDATKDAVHAAGGDSFVALTLGRSQSTINDYCHDHTALFMPLNLVERLEALGVGSPGAPHITRALARARGLSVSCETLADLRDMDDLGDWLAAVTKEIACLVSAVAGEDLSKGPQELSVASRKRIGRPARAMIERLEQLCRAIDSP
jgi:hypothetical protein